MTIPGPVRRFLKWAGIALAVLLALCLAAVGALRLQFAGTPAAWAKSTGHDALWMGHAWVDGRKTAADVDRLAARIRQSGISDVYVHSGPFGADGTLPPDKYPNARNFLKWWQEKLPGVRVSAWLGQVVDEDVDGHVDLADPATRARIVAGAKALTDLGFDGVHYDFEPVPDGDPAFLSVLKETRRAVGGKLLSVATQQIEPLPGLRFPLRLVIGHEKYWTTGYFAQVAALTDQVAVMTYDSWTPLPSLYGGHVVRQAELAMDAAPPGTAVLIGAPAYHDHIVGLSDHAESVATAADGARLALTEHGPRAQFGMALYVDFAATEEDWKEYQTAWVRPGLPPAAGFPG
ncbi:membrane protein [Planotetraspora thailandica]|uniref:Membrane protein n=1 Tax=Planotetraspora thailandica TaxID=487172 RepID=A0A8J3V3R9_9ACTN|nr:membrane protein [Planotetraspora thailandica]